MGTRIPLSKEELDQIAQSALDKADDPVNANYDQLNESRNLTLLLFLRELKRALIAKGEATVWTQTLAKASRGVQTLCYRPWDDTTLVACKGIGKALAKIIRDHLWALDPVDPPDAEDQANYQAYIAGEQAQQAQAKEHARAAKAATAPMPPVAPVLAPAERQGEEGGEGAERPSKRKKKTADASKTYLPKPGTANWALLVALLKAHRAGEEFLLKELLLDRAEATGLSTKPIRSAGGPPQNAGRGFGYQSNPAAFYSGWSGMTKLLNNQPPYVMKYSNPAKYKLTPDGQAIAEQLYLSSIQRGQLMEPFPPDLLAKHPQFAGVGPGPLTAAAAVPSAAVANVVAAAAAVCPAPAPVLPPSGPSHGAAMRDADVAQIVRMGYSREQALQALDGGRTVQEACDVLLLAAEDDESAFPHLSQSQSQYTAAMSSQLVLSQPARLRTDAESVPNGLRPGVVGTTAAQGRPQGPIGPPGAAPAGGPALPRERDGYCAALPPRPSISLSGSLAAAEPRRSATSNGAVVTRLPSGVDVVAPNEWKMDSFPSRQPLQHSLASRTVRLPPLEPGTCFRDAYEVVLCIDIREQFGVAAGGAAGGICRRTSGLQSQVERLQRMGTLCETRKLEIADALWVARHKTTREEYCLDFVAERKNVCDLAQSIKDNRYPRQKLMMQQCGLRNLCYIVEGRVQEYSSLGASEQQAVKTATAASMVQDGFKVLRTDDVHCTARLYHDITQFLVTMYGPQRGHGDVGSPGALLPTFQVFTDRVKQHSSRKEWTVRDVWGAMLATIRGVSSNVAEAMTAVHPTPQHMSDHFKAVAAQSAAADAAEQALAGLQIDQTRKVSMLQSKTVFNHFFHR